MYARRPCRLQPSKGVLDGSHRYAKAFHQLLLRGQHLPRLEVTDSNELFDLADDLRLFGQVLVL